MSISEIMDIVGNVVIVLGIVFMVIGVFGLFKFKDFYPRLLIASKIDTVGLMTLLFGICIRQGFSFFSAKVLFVVLIILILNPLVAHVIAQGAYRAGYTLEGTLTEVDSEDIEENQELEEGETPVEKQESVKNEQSEENQELVESETPVEKKESVANEPSEENQELAESETPVEKQESVKKEKI